LCSWLGWCCKLCAHFVGGLCEERPTRELRASSVGRVHVVVRPRRARSTLLKGTKSREGAFRIIPATFQCSDAHLGSTEWLEFSKEFTHAGAVAPYGAPLGWLGSWCAEFGVWP
jgi:hypothetical protein